MNQQTLRTTAFTILLILMLAIPAAIMSYKLLVLDYPLAGLIPVTSYHVDVSMQVDGHGGDIELGTYLPKTDSRQMILDEENVSGVFSLSLQSDAENRVATWKAENVRGRHNVRYSFSAQSLHVKYVLPESLGFPDSIPNSLKPFLQEEPGIQVHDPLIQQELEKLNKGPDFSLKAVLTKIHRHLQDDFTNKNFSGFTDALTALKLGEASCNGKGRLFVAMARQLGIPARLVGGVILKSGSKRTSHQWVELYLNGHWVPFDTINDHFAELPANYLTLYYGDLVLFRHSANVNFQYFFKTIKRLVPRQETQAALGSSAFNIVNVFAIFERVGISLNLLKILLMIPLGAFIVVIFRNVVGLETFGTFLPALIAAAARETGIVWGMLGFVLIIITAAMARKVFDWIQLLHSPKMAIVLTTVVIIMLIMTVLGVHFELFDLAHITLFPIAILAITAERFSIIIEEQGYRKAFRITFTTMFVIVACYYVMDSLFLQSLILAFPELLLVVIALNMWLGKWIGMRMSEFYRFRKVIFGPQA